MDNLYRKVWDYSIKERLIKHSSYPGFRGFVCLSDNEDILGFTYGYSSLPGQYYHDILVKELDSTAYELWLKDCFELVELVVHPSYRNQGYAKGLVTELLKDVQNKTTVLTTQVSNHSARRLYQGLGWADVKEPFFPSNEGTPYVIMGKVLK
ncbi:GNAT family N-acetyltransferase [Mesobacillus maritimus]|uniref:GNAT family N-acetyltransferase n=2 Tax=Mesobacillus maritimus TaxID=1643336 RepID=A0ABS7K779_9BACI|nr:GNAT family N-acetyltransferase [Mesobacillus maritimus]